MTCLHADEPAGVEGVLERCGADGAGLERVGLELFIGVEGGGWSPERRVRSLFCRTDGGLTEAWRWERGTDEFVRAAGREDLCAAVAGRWGAPAGELAAEWERREEFLRALCEPGCHFYEEVRDAVRET